MKALLFFLLLFLGATLVLMPSCRKDNEETLFPISDCDTVQVSYDSFILPTIRNNCYSCHNAISAIAGVNLEGYNNLKVYANNGLLVEVLELARPNPRAMPPDPGPSFDPCTLLKIKSWIANGAPEN